MSTVIKDNKSGQIKLQKILTKLKKTPHVAVGILQDKPHDKGISMVDLATIHEYGTKDGRIPERSFIRSTCDVEQKKHLNYIKVLLGKIIDGSSTLKQSLNLLGEVVSKDIVKTINAGINPVLKESTIKHKKSSKPLIDTGRLKGAITHEVRGI